MIEKFPELKLFLENLAEQRPLLISNMEKECNYKKINKEFMKILLNEMNSIIKSNPLISDPEVLIIELKRRLRIYFLGNKINRSNIPPKVYHFKEFDVLWNYCLYKNIKKFSDSGLEEEKREVRQNLIDGKELDPELLEDSGLGDPRKGFYWVSNPDFRRVKNSQEIYRMIGKQLDEKDAMDDLVQITLKPQYLFCPTVFDSHLSRFFRTANRPDMWGESLNISDGFDFEGFPEAISEDIEISEALNNRIIEEIKILGQIYSSDGFSKDQWISICGTP